jgi:hypothetical protein
MTKKVWNQPIYHKDACGHCKARASPAAAPSAAATRNSSLKKVLFARSEPTEDVAIKANKPKTQRSAAPPPATSAATSPAAALPSSRILQEEDALKEEEV